MQRYSGLRDAVVEFLEDRDGLWSLEVVTMPSRGEYQGGDYSLAVLSRETAGGSQKMQKGRLGGVNLRLDAGHGVSFLALSRSRSEVQWEAD